MAPAKILAFAAAGVIVAGVLTFAMPYRGPAGPGMFGWPGYGMGPGMMGPYGYGPGYSMGPGMGPGMMWGGPPRSAIANRELSVDDVKGNLERWLAFHGNDRLKIGDVVQKDERTIEATIVTKKENAVVQRYSVERRTGFFRPIGG